MDITSKFILVHIKDGAFLPDYICIIQNAVLQFLNEDDVSHTVSLSGYLGYLGGAFNVLILPHQSVQQVFKTTGHFVFSNQDQVQSKCMIEVIEEKKIQNSKKIYFPTRKDNKSKKTSEKDIISEDSVINRISPNQIAEFTDDTICQSIVAKKVDEKFTLQSILRSEYESHSESENDSEDDLEVGYVLTRNDILRNDCCGKSKADVAKIVSKNQRMYYESDTDTEYEGSGDENERKNLLRIRTSFKTKHASSNKKVKQITLEENNAGKDSSESEGNDQFDNKIWSTVVKPSSLLKMGSSKNEKLLNKNKTMKNGKISQGYIWENEQYAEGSQKVTHQQSTPIKNEILQPVNYERQPHSVQSSSVMEAPVPNTDVDIQILIQDYEFSPSQLYIDVGDIINFVLAPDVPIHAEHLLVGVSDVEELRFESPLLSQIDCNNFKFIPNKNGVIHVSCKIYPHMNMLITIKGKEEIIEHSQQGSLGSKVRRYERVSMLGLGKKFLPTSPIDYKQIKRNYSKNDGMSPSSSSYYDSDDFISSHENNSYSDVLKTKSKEKNKLIGSFPLMSSNQMNSDNSPLSLSSSIIQTQTNNQNPAIEESPGMDSLGSLNLSITSPNRSPFLRGGSLSTKRPAERKSKINFKKIPNIPNRINLEDSDSCLINESILQTVPSHHDNSPSIDTNHENAFQSNSNKYEPILMRNENIPQNTQVNGESTLEHRENKIHDLIDLNVVDINVHVKAPIKATENRMPSPSYAPLFGSFPKLDQEIANGLNDCNDEILNSNMTYAERKKLKAKQRYNSKIKNKKKDLVIPIDTGNQPTIVDEKGLRQSYLEKSVDYEVILLSDDEEMIDTETLHELSGSQTEEIKTEEQACLIQEEEEVIQNVSPTTESKSDNIVITDLEVTVETSPIDQTNGESKPLKLKSKKRKGVKNGQVGVEMGVKEVNSFQNITNQCEIKSVVNEQNQDISQKSNDLIAISMIKNSSHSIAVTTTTTAIATSVSTITFSTSFAGGFIEHSHHSRPNNAQEISELLDFGNQSNIDQIQLHSELSLPSEIEKPVITATAPSTPFDSKDTVVTPVITKLDVKKLFSGVYSPTATTKKEVTAPNHVQSEIIIHDDKKAPEIGNTLKEKSMMELYMTELEEKFKSRFDIIRGLYEQHLPDTWPNGRQVKIYKWDDLFSNVIRSHEVMSINSTEKIILDPQIRSKSNHYKRKKRGKIG